MRLLAMIVLFIPIALLAQTKPASSSSRPANDLPTLWLVGDSTVRNGSGNGGNGQWGWGDRIAGYFDTNKINVVNRARGGRSSRSYITEGLWDAVLADSKPGDFVIIQMGHNDGGPLAGDNRERGSIRGIDEKTEDVTLTLGANKGKKETVHTYGWYLRKYIADAREHKLTPILCSPIPRRPKTQVDPTSQPTTYALWAEEVATAEHVPFVDLNRIILKHYAGMKPDEIKSKYFTTADDTHTNADGADLNASAVIEGLRALSDDPLKAYLLAEPKKLSTSGNAPVVVSCPGEVGSPYTRSFPMPEGNDDVTVTLGAPDVDATTTVLAEQRRLMLERVHTKPGESVKRTFTVNVRRPGSIKLKPRETNYLNWDDQLTLTFLGTPAAVTSIEIGHVESAVTVFLAGDSTVTDQPNEPYNSWGQMLPRFFKQGVAVANYAESGESLKSFKGSHRTDEVLNHIKKGDWLFIQFAHNDMKQKGEGVGAFTTYKADLESFALEAKKRGAHPVLVTSMNRRSFDDSGKITNSLGDYPEAVRRVAKEQDLPLIDLNVMSKTLYEAWGKAPSPRAFAPKDNTHHNDYGSYELARCVVEGIRQNKLELARFLADDIAPFDPAHPDSMGAFSIPRLPPPTTAATTKPEGN
jgi:lysophospholipase L1-like esterase